MKTTKSKKPAIWLITAMGVLTLAVVVAACAAPGGATGPKCKPDVTVFLRAEQTTITMPDGRVVPMWGYAGDSAFGANDGTVTVPGPALNLCSAVNTLTIVLDNNLPVPTSIVINGQRSDMTPVKMGNGRMRSFTPETPPGNGVPGVYQFSNLRPGSFLYQSGTHPAVQVQMGLYGAMVKNYAGNMPYPGVHYAASSTVVYSEVDPDLHDAVATNNYGPGMAVTSTVNFHPKYLLLNGDPNLTNGGILSPTPPGANILLRFINAGIATHTPLFVGIHATVIAEDGFPYTYPKSRYALPLMAGKTMDAIVRIPASGTVSFVPDRMISHM